MWENTCRKSLRSVLSHILKIWNMRSRSFKNMKWTSWIFNSMKGTRTNCFYCQLEEPRPPHPIAIPLFLPDAQSSQSHRFISNTTTPPDPWSCFKSPLRKTSWSKHIILFIELTRIDTWLGEKIITF